MPTYTTVLIDGDVPSAWYAGHHGSSRLVRLASGTLWNLFCGSDSKVYAKSSTDDGASWSARELVFNPTTPVSANQWNLHMTVDASDRPIAVMTMDDANGQKQRFFRREGSSWTQKAAITPTFVAGITTSFRQKLFQHPTSPNTWIFIGADLGGPSSKHRIYYVISTDDMATWGAINTLHVTDYSGPSSSGDADYVLTPGSDLIQGVHSYKSGVERVAEVALSGWDASPSLSVTDLGYAFSLAQAAASYAVGLKSNGDMYWAYWEYSFGVGNMRLKLRTRVAGVWSAADDAGHVTFNQTPDTRMYVDISDDFHILANPNNIGVNSTFQHPVVFTKPAGWTYVVLVDDAADAGSISHLEEAWRDGGTNEVGYAMGWADSTNADDYFLSSSDVVYPAPTTTEPPTTPPPTTIPVTTIPPVTTVPPTTIPPVTTLPPVVIATIRSGRMFKRRLRQVVVRAWSTDVDTEAIVDNTIEPTLCTCGLYSETTKLREVGGEADPAGPEFVRFVLPDLYPMPGEAYFLRVNLVNAAMEDLGTRDFFFGTT